MKVAPSTVTLAPGTGLSVSPDTIVSTVPATPGAGGVVGAVGPVGPPPPPSHEAIAAARAAVTAAPRIQLDTRAPLLWLRRLMQPCAGTRHRFGAGSWEPRIGLATRRNGGAQAADVKRLAAIGRRRRCGMSTRPWRRVFKPSEGPIPISAHHAEVSRRRSPHSSYAAILAICSDSTRLPYLAPVSGSVGGLARILPAAGSRTPAALRPVRWCPSADSR
jgi:hypothetical protein